MHSADGALPLERMAGGWQPLEHGSTLICWADLQNYSSGSLSKRVRKETSEEERLGDALYNRLRRKNLAFNALLSGGFLVKKY